MNIEPPNKEWLRQSICRARSQSKRWKVTVEVHHCIKGRGKGSIEDVVVNECDAFWNGSVTEILAVYEGGVRIYKYTGGKARLKVW